MRVLSSADGEKYTEIGKLNKVEGEGRGVVIETNLPLQKSQGRYLKFEIENYGMIPDGKQGAGHRAWLFVDEIEVD